LGSSGVLAETIFGVTPVALAGFTVSARAPPGQARDVPTGTQEQAGEHGRPFNQGAVEAGTPPLQHPAADNVVIHDLRQVIR
jgi:hypothetical protein